MSVIGTGSSRVIVDVDGEAATVTSGKLDVNAYLNATPTIDIGDVSLLLGGTAADTNNGTAGAQTLRVTLASDSSMPNTNGYGTIAHGNNADVDTSDEALTTSTACKHVDIMATTTNAGIIYVGASGVTAATGIALYAGDVYSVDIDNLADIYVITSQVNQAVQWVYYV